MSFRSISAISAVENYHVDLAVMSCKGFDIDNGITDTSEDNAELKKAFIRSANRRILAVDHTKFDKVSFVKICNNEEVDVVVTDVAPSDKWIKELDKKEIELIF